MIIDAAPICWSNWLLGSRNDAPGRHWREFNCSSRICSLCLLSLRVSLAILACSTTSSEYMHDILILLSSPNTLHCSKCSCVSLLCASPMPHLRGQYSEKFLYYRNFFVRKKKKKKMNEWFILIKTYYLKCLPLKLPSFAVFFD